MHKHIALSKLHPGKQNPRWVKPRPEAQQRLVASIRAFGLLEPLLVRPKPDADGEYQIIAGNRRLSALRQIHRNSKEDPKISCEVQDVDDPTAGAMALSENFVRENMHPLDEAEAFSRLASDEAKGVDSIASDFGVSEKYVRQRMKLAGLANVVKTAFRQNEIDTATAEAFAAVPEDRQLAIWKEIGGKPHGASHVWSIIASAWVSAEHALFDLSAVPESAVTRDLFNDHVLIERSAFMEAQTQALAKQQEELKEQGWANVIVGPWDELRDRVHGMGKAEPELDAKTTRKLAKLDERRHKLFTKLQALSEDDGDAGEALQEKAEHLEALAQQVVNAAPKNFSEETKAVGTVFLTLQPDGRVIEEFRVPRQDVRRSTGNGADGEPNQLTAPPTSDDLSDRQLADTFSHQTLAVREALLKAPTVRKRLLAMILHDKVRSEALAMRRDANGVTVHATQSDGFASPILDRLMEKRADLDPFASEHYVDDRPAYERLSELSDAKLVQLIDLLLVECLTAHLQRRTELVCHLAAELKVDLRKSWHPDAAWLASYQKIQLAHLMAELRGSLYDPRREARKKSELVEALAKLFTDAAEGKLDDKKLAERVNGWLPVNLRSETDANERHGDE